MQYLKLIVFLLYIFVAETSTRAQVRSRSLRRFQRACSSAGEPPLEERERQSVLVFSGIIESYFPEDPRTNNASGTVTPGPVLRVRVKRIIKGDRLLENRLVTIEGIVNSYCHGNKVRLRDTRIFLANYSTPSSGGDDKLKLRANFKLLAVNLRTLQKLRAAVQDSAELRQTSVEDKIDPCLNLKCPPGAQCLVESNGKTASCRCPTFCPSYGSSSHVICGSDGKDYSSLCELHKASCLANKTIQIQFAGSCDPCSSLDCPAPSVCVLGSDRVPQCLCDTSCPNNFDPVCGSDGCSYASRCHMTQESCRTGRSLRILYKGLCESGSNPCESAGCLAEESCQVAETGIARCVCPEACPSVYRPVCGSDGSTYASLCELKRQSCVHRRNLTIAYEGQCGSSDVCADFECPEGGFCIEMNGKPQCNCLPCGNEWDPVCGSDGVTYTNLCHLNLENCSLNKTIRSAYKGMCNGCDKKECDFYSQCAVDETGEATCVCPDNCTEELESLVCGTDGITYRNLCELKSASCRKQQLIIAASSGDCDLCKDVQCRNGARCEDGTCVCPTDCPESSDGQICGSDGNSYSSECEMQKAACDIEAALHVVHSGPCSAAIAENLLEGFPLRKCNCNKLGSLNNTCDPLTLQCPCKDGVAGRKCDRCLPGFWGLHLNVNDSGCQPCECHRLGSLRDDCEQMTGRCVCKSEATSSKCDRCVNGRLIDETQDGCGLTETAERETKHCSDLNCRFGAICQDLGGQAVCLCPMDCPEASEEHSVCGSDSFTYPSECDLRLAACSRQTSIDVAYEGPCMEDTNFKPAGDTGVSKATRHVAEISSPEWDRPDVIALKTVVKRPSVTSVRLRSHLGDRCSVNEDCLSISNSICLEFTCACTDGYAGSLDKRQCLENLPSVAVEASLSSCNSSPCLGGGSCQPLGIESFICICPPERTGSLCERRIAGEDEEAEPWETPAFHGQSYVELKRIKSLDKLSIELEFKSLLNDGIIMYSQQNRNGADYLSLALVAGHVEFRFDVGNGPVVLRSFSPIKLGQWHRVLAQRYRQDGWLRVDNDEDIAATSPGIHQSLDLDGSVYLGSVPVESVNTRIYENIGTISGFVGCIRRLKFGRKSISFRIPAEGRKNFNLDHKQRNYVESFANPLKQSNVVKMSGITQCGENPCRKNPCMNNGSCLWKNGYNFTCSCKEGFGGRYCETILNPCAKDPCTEGSTCVPLHGRYVCKCPEGKKGTHCNESDGSKHEVVVPEFMAGVHSFIALPQGSLQLATNLDLEVWFLTRSSDGILVYAAQDLNGRGDFIWLGILGGRIQFRWDLGSGAGVVTSSERVTLYEWHRVLVSRRGKDASLKLDDRSSHQGRSLGPLSELNLDTPFYIGGLKSNVSVPRDVPKLAAFQGAIQRLIINGEVFDKLIDSSIQREGVNVYRGPPCGYWPVTFNSRTSSLANNSPCFNGGLCQPLLANFVCKCPNGFTGKRCEKRIGLNEADRSTVRFNGKTFLKFPNQIKRIAKSHRTNRFEIRFRTESANGLILWLSRGRSSQADYFAVAVVRSFVELGFNLGKQNSFLTARSHVNVSDGHWHTVVVERKKRSATIQVDNEKPVRVIAEHGATVLNISGKLWIGGNGLLPVGLPSPYYNGFTGCMERVKVDDHVLDWYRHGDNTILQYCEDLTS